MSDYKIEIAFGGGDIRLTIIDASTWAPGNGLLVIGASANAPQSSTTTVSQKDIHFVTADGQTKVDSTLSIFVSSGLGILNLTVVNDGTVTVKSPVDSFVENKAGSTTHQLKLR
jgi:hypothetical protein